jgi:hypothetical protein
VGSDSRGKWQWNGKNLNKSFLLYLSAPFLPPWIQAAMAANKNMQCTTTWTNLTASPAKH